TPNNSTSGTVTTAGTYTLTVSDPANGCASSATVVVSTNTTVPNATTLAASAIDCNNSTSTLSGNSTTGGATFSWEGPTAGTPAGTTPTTATTDVTLAGTYTVTVTDPANGCTDTATVSVTANTSTPQVSVGAGTSLNCSLTPVTLSGSSSTGSVTFSWEGPTTGTPAGTTPTNDSTDVVVGGTFTLTVTDPTNGCTSSATVVVSPNAGVPQINAGGNQNINCISTTATLNGSSTTSGATFAWEGPTTGTPAGTTPNNSSTGISQSGTYTLTVTDPSNGCTSTQQVTVSVDTIAPTLNASANSTSINCTQTSITLTATASGSSPNIVWTGPSGIVPGNPATVSAPGTYSVTVTDPANGCTTSTTINITSNVAIPIITSGVNNDTLNCANTSADLSVTTPNTNLVYSWVGPNSFTSNQQNLNGITNAGTYIVTVVDTTNGCSVVDTITIIQGTNPIAGFTATPTSGTSPLNVSFTNTSTSGFSGYDWNLGNGTTSTQTNPTDIYTTPGTYTVILIGVNANPACNDTVTAIIVVDEAVTIEVPNIFTPNGDGTNDFFFIKSTGLKDLQVDIYNRWGQLEKQLFGINAIWDGKNLNTQDASDGTYYFILKAIALDGKEIDREGYLLLSR
ncbi:MAG: gliding motility-associated C-terminal domain-containing protein, partial [Bacteroidia bacterium]|nr:gliding motility-associated C-terminal domain-containing protein [Bacteroidia bacterium]